ncbi:MAG: AAA-like domain-containing protein [Phormidesmis sp.]
MEFPCGALGLESPFYLERPPIELLCYQNIEMPGSLTRIKGPRHTGKSSLLVRLLSHAQRLQYRTVLVDFQAAEGAVYSDLSRFLRWFCGAVAWQLKLPANLDDYWDEETGAKLSATIYFEDYLLSAIESPIVLALNEVNRVFEHPEIACDFLPLLRFWYEQAKQESAQPGKVRLERGFQKLRTVVVHSTEIYVPLNIHQSPFNVGLPITLGPFDDAQIKALAGRYGVAFGEHQDDEQLTEQLKTLIGGHPYLLSVAFYYLRQGQRSLSQLIAEAPTAAGIYYDHLQACWAHIRAQPALAEVLRRVVSASDPVWVEGAIAHQLSSLGLVTLSGSTCRPVCELYRIFFAEQFAQRRDQVLNRQEASPVNLPVDRPESLPVNLPEILSMDIRGDDIQRLRAENEQLKVLANLDGLTQIANRRRFDQQIERVWQRSIEQPSRIALIMLDIDFFKLYNDTYGHMAGDFCLKQVAAVLRDRARKSSDIVARYGGEEFAIILPETDLSVAHNVASQLRAGIRVLNIAHRSSKLASKIITPSIGVAGILPKRGQSATDLIAAADAALYVSKQQGRDRITLSDTLSGYPLQRLGHE